MARFKQIAIHEDSGTVDIGAGLTWTDVYAFLVPKGLNVVGGRLNGVGVAGLTLGGGKLSFHTSPSTCPSDHRTNLIECLSQDILGKQISMGSLRIPLLSSSSCYHVVR